MYPPELEKGTKGRQRNRRSLLRSGGRTGCGCEVTVDPAPAGPYAHSGVAARASGGGPSDCGRAGASVVTDTEGWVCETSRGHRFRTSIGTRTERHGRTARANREPAVLSAAAEKGIRCAGGVQYGGSLRSAVAPAAARGRAARAHALQ